MGCKNQAQREENDARGGRPYQVEASCSLYRQVVTGESQHDSKDRRPNNGDLNPAARPVSTGLRLEAPAPAPLRPTLQAS
jgi:hypothetical protein